MSSQFLVAIDAGTTSNRVIIFDNQGRIVWLKSTALPQIYPQSGWVEHDPMHIWNHVHALLHEALCGGSVNAHHIAALGITNQRETVLLWDQEGRPLHNAIVWQDRRGAPICEELIKDGLEEYIHDHTGLVIDAYFSASKLAWLFRQSSSLRHSAHTGKVHFGTVDSWLLYKLTGGKVHATDYTNASRTMLYDIRARAWDHEILKRLAIPSQILPAVHPSSHHFGALDATLFDGVTIPICGVAGDQQAALFGQTCFETGMAKNTYGTGSFALINIGQHFRRSRHRLLTTIAWGIDNTLTYALEGSIFITGAAIQWLRDALGIIADAAESETLAQSIPSNNDVYFVPALVGLGSPHWDMYARGIIIGLSRNSGRAEIVRAALESLAYQSREVLDAMASDAQTPLKILRVDGGAVVNNFLMQFQADILGLPVSRPQVTESTARGAAFLAGLAVGVWDSLTQIASIWQEERRFNPSIEFHERERLFRRWQEAVERCKGWHPDRV